MNNIDELLENYFEGQTSMDEEALMRRFFTSGDVPENLAMYKPLFAYFDSEIKKSEIASEDKKPTEIGDERVHAADEHRISTNMYESDVRPIQKSKRFVLWLSGAAACAAILTGIFFFGPSSKKCPGEGDYVIIDGRCYTDEKTIRSATLNTLREISDDNDDFQGDKSSKTKRIIENQLKEFDSFFDE